MKTTTATTADSIVADAYFPALRDDIISATGLVFYEDRPQSLARYVGERLSERGLDDCRSYLNLLDDEQSGPTELDQLVALLTIGETYFFRHQELFDALRDAVLPEIIDRNRHSRRLRIWSAGCSNGAEAYSVAILLRRDLGHRVQGWDISILGTDINRTFLAQATEGQYEEWAFRGTSADLRRDCFEQHGATWRIAPRFCEGVAFQYHNLADQPFRPPVLNPAAFDLILCRNVLIYFGPDFVERVVAQLAECLAPDGWLAVGHAEHGGHFQNNFETVQFPGAILYRKSKRGEGGQVDAPQLSSEAPGLTLNSLSQGVTVEPDLHDAQAAMAPCTHEPLSNARDEHPPAAETPIELQQIRALADEGRIDDALERCADQIEREPLNPIGYFYEALLLDLTGRHASALRSLQKTIYLDRQLVLAHYYAGLIREKLGHVDEALTAFRNVDPLLAGRTSSERLPDAGDMTVADLQALTRMHIETLEAS